MQFLSSKYTTIVAMLVTYLMGVALTNQQCQNALGCSPTNCIVVGGRATCLQCLDGYFLENGDNCARCSNGCTSCTSKSKCKGCEAGHCLHFASQKCIRCANNECSFCRDPEENQTNPPTTTPDNKKPSSGETNHSNPDSNISSQPSDDKSSSFVKTLLAVFIAIGGIALTGTIFYFFFRRRNTAKNNTKVAPIQVPEDFNPASPPITPYNPWNQTAIKSSKRGFGPNPLRKRIQAISPLPASPNPFNSQASDIQLQDLFSTPRDQVNDPTYQLDRLRTFHRGVAVSIY